MPVTLFLKLLPLSIFKWILPEAVITVVGEKPQKSTFRIYSEERTCSLIQNCKSFSRRYTYTGEAAAPSGGRLGESTTPPHPAQDKVSFL